MIKSEAVFTFYNGGGGGGGAGGGGGGGAIIFNPASALEYENTIVSLSVGQ